MTQPRLSARMTLPSASRPVLMWTDSLRRRPVFPVRAARSDPDRSTRWSLEERTEALPASRTLSNSSAEVAQSTNRSAATRPMIPLSSSGRYANKGTSTERESNFLVENTKAELSDDNIIP
uniref:Uncharacterized protein n=1 Tax=Hucho hucho TaxID=62062 RepID=A0A4W5M6Z0_9TELE